MLDIFKSNTFNEKSTSTLKLVVSNQSIPSRDTNFSCNQANIGFTTEVQGRGPYLYSLLARDPSHYLECELTLETQEREDENTLKPLEVICHFPNISDEELNNYVWEDESLLGMILIQFQMKIMEQLLMFCSNQYASNLIIYTDDAQAESLGIYREFLFTEGYPLPQVVDNPEISIPINDKTIHNWAKYMNKLNIQFHQTLWREQRLNPAIRQYLKTHH